MPARQIRSMEKLGDDEVALILKLVDDPNDRARLSEVCKQWLRLEGVTRSSLRVLQPDHLHQFIQRFPNLVTFESSFLITDSELELVSQTCPNIEILKLKLVQSHRSTETTLTDVGDEGICALATGCRKLSKVSLKNRKRIGGDGVFSLVQSAANLTTLKLRECNGITDRALEAIGSAKLISVLNLHGCSSITDCGLAHLANGSVSKTLKKLSIAGCDQITDVGVLLLQKMCCLEELDLSECGPKVTDVGGVGIAAIQSIKLLNLSWLINISDVTIIAIAHGCRSLKAVDLTGCELITGAGICAFNNHESLEAIALVSCYRVYWDDVVQTVQKCESLQFIMLDKLLRSWMPEEIQDRISRLCTLEYM